MENKNDKVRVTVEEAGLGQFKQNISIGKHLLIADEPIASGGNDAGPSPYDFILAGLGACTSMTIRMYANLKKFPLKKVIVNLSIEKIYADDCQNCDNNNQAKIDHITRVIDLQGDLSKEQRARLLDIANKCPVHRTLTSKIMITTQLIETKTSDAEV